MLMQYRLCDILTWIDCPELSGPVPIHIRRKYESPDKAVSGIIMKLNQGEFDISSHSSTWVASQVSSKEGVI